MESNTYSAIGNTVRFDNELCQSDVDYSQAAFDASQVEDVYDDGSRKARYESAMAVALSVALELFIR